MKRTTVPCPYCSRGVSKSNLLIHSRSCSLRPTQPGEDLEAERNKRSEKARLANAASQANRRVEIDRWIETGPFEELSITHKRARILLEQNGRCEACGIEQTWNGKPLKFELDHISGIRSDESRSNLRLICPNCHQQTPTYKTSNRNQKGCEPKVSDAELIELLKKHETIQAVLLEAGMNVHGRNYKRCRRLVVENKLNIGLLI